MSPPVAEATPGELADLAEDVARSAGALLIDGLRTARRVVSTKSSATDLVTEVDRRAERLIVEAILAARPADSIVGEEGTEHRGTSGVGWVLDPIDGTTNYLYGHPGFAVSVAATLDEQVVAGVVVDPLHDDVFKASLGGGATRNGEPIRPSSEHRLGHALVATGFGYEPQRRREQAAVLAELLPRVRDMRRMGAAAVDLCSVACGRVDAYYERGLQLWDHAAGALVATEAGATVGDLAGGPPSSELTLASTPGVFDELRELLARLHAA